MLKNFSQISIFNILSIIIITLTKQYSTYNFAGKQNFEIDQMYGQIPGFQSYTYLNNKTLIIFDVYPDSFLTFNFKIYSNETGIKNYFDSSNFGLYIGFSFLLNNTVTNTDPKWRSDSMICFINKYTSSCLDYIYSFNDNKYFKNQIQNTESFLMSSKIIKLIYDLY